MKLGIISDTHIPTRAPEIPEKVFEIFQGVDMILHAGDLEELQVIDELQKIAKVIAVHGNMDDSNIREKLPEKEIIKIAGKNIGLTHGYGAPFGIINRVRQLFNEKLDCIIFGHTHQPFNEIKDGILFFNPGSPTDTVFTNINAVGILNINKKINGEIIRL